jgi:hypothetical protein
MKSAAPATVSTITNDYHNVVTTIVQAEWQLNRFFRAVADNTPAEDTNAFDNELFPIESIIANNRPTSGICKAVVGQAVVQSEYHDTVPSARFYTVDPDDEYKYWQSPQVSAAVSPFAMANCAPQVTYVAENDVAGAPVPITVTANKITFTVENTYAYPADYDVQVKYTTGGAWTTVASDIAIPSNGRVQLWYNGTNWTTTKDLTSSRTVSAVRLVVNQMNKEAYFNLIELGLCLEKDLTADLMGWSDDFNMGEPDFITPLGNISSNGGNITLFNGDAMTYHNDNPASPYYDMLDKGVIVRCWTKYGTDLIQEFELFSDSWDAAEDSTSVSLVDGSRYFMEAKPQPVLYRNIPVQEAVWRICDTIGFTNYEITALDGDPHSIIDIFWTDGEKTAWELFGELARGTQTAIYFDSYGVLQVKTRGAAWNPASGSVFSFLRNTVPGGQLSNIAQLNESTEYEANKVTVNWQPTDFSERVDNITPFEVVWEPEGDVVLRATELAQNLLIGDTTVYLSQREGKTWPWQAIMNIEGEWISTDAKKYTYYDATNTRQTVWVESYAEQQRLDAITDPSWRHLNNYSGALRVKQRGLYNSAEADHRIDLTNWTTTRRNNYTTNISPTSGVMLNEGESTVTISTQKDKGMNDYTYLHHGNPAADGYKYMGFKMKINESAHKDKVAGFFFNGGVIGTGYFLEIMATARMDGAMRATRNEVMLYSMNADGSKKVFGGETVVMKDKSKNHEKNAKTKKDIGARVAVPMDTWEQFDIWYTPGTEDIIRVFVNGNFLFQANVTGTWKQAKSERMGFYARGYSMATFDYVYGVNSAGVEMIDSESYYDRIEGGWYSNQDADWQYDTKDAARRKKKNSTKNKIRYNERFYSEFGPVAHEIREFDVKFTSETPVLESKLYFSNTTQAICTEYVGDVKSGKFVMANKSRQPAVINGDDQLTAGGNTINHKFFVYGRPVIQKDSQTVEKVDEKALRRRGVIETEYSSIWIQNYAEADRFAEWLTTHWSDSDSTLSVEVFGNPLIELTDVVHVTYNHIDANFYVTGFTNTWDNGLATTLTLRKV